MTDQIEHFLQALFAGVPGRIEVRPKGRNAHHYRVFAATIDEARAAIEAAERAGLNVWVGVATRSEAGAAAFARRERQPPPGGLHYLQSSRVFYVDLDRGEGEEQQDLLDRLDSFAMPPSMVVETAQGGGLHCYWLLDEPLDLSTDEARARYSDTIRGLVDALSADPGAVDAARILRVSGTTNRPSQEKRARGRTDSPCSVLRPFEGRIYGTEAFGGMAERGAALRGNRAAAAADYASTEWHGQIPSSVQALLDLRRDVRDLFDGTPGPGQANDDSVIDFSLAMKLAHAGVEPAEIEHALRASRQLRGDYDQKDNQYFTRTTEKAVGEVEAFRCDEYARLALDVTGTLVSGSLAEMQAVIPPQLLAPPINASDAEYGDYFRRTRWGRDQMWVGNRAFVFDGKFWNSDGAERLIEHNFMSAVSGHESAISFQPDATVMQPGPRGARPQPRQVRGLHHQMVHARRQSGGVANVMQRVRPRCTEPQEGLGRHFEYLNCQNCVVDLRTGQTFSHAKARELRITVIASAEWSPDATDPHVERFLKTSLADPKRRRLVAQLLGITLISTQVVNAKVLPILFSQDPNTGKTALLEGFAATLGSYSVPITTQLFLSRRSMSNDHNSMLAKLEGKRFAYGSEITANLKIDDGLLKNLTGGDTIVARDVGDKQKQFVPEFTPWFAANNVPVIDVHQQSAWERILVIEFKREGPVDPELRSLLQTSSARTAWLATAYAGLRDYWENGLVVPQCVVDAREKARGEADWLSEFIDAHFVRETGHRVLVTDVQQQYRQYAGREAVTIREFNATMEHAGFERSVNRSQWLGLRVRKAQDGEDAAL